MLNSVLSIVCYILFIVWVNIIDTTRELTWIWFPKHTVNLLQRRVMLLFTVHVIINTPLDMFEESEHKQTQQSIVSSWSAAQAFDGDDSTRFTSCVTTFWGDSHQLHNQHRAALMTGSCRHCDASFPNIIYRPNRVVFFFHPSKLSWTPSWLCFFFYPFFWTIHLPCGV